MKTITIRDETYRFLLMLKVEGDSFGDVIDRLIEENPGTIRRFAGALEDSEVLDSLREFTKKLRVSGSRGHDSPRRLVPRLIARGSAPRQQRSR